MEALTVGARWSLLGWMYGTRTVLVPPRCPASSSSSSSASAQRDATAQTAGPALKAGPARTVGLVLAADGSQPKYADAVYVSLHNIRVLQRSMMAVEVFHVGMAEAFSPQAAGKLTFLGQVSVLDMLPRLHPRIRSVAATRLRSFASKPFALLASSFDVAIVVDANALFFQPPEALLTLSSYSTLGVQLFTDYVHSYQIVDPWVVSDYLGAGLADVEAYVAIAQGAEIDSSVVIVDKTRTCIQPLPRPLYHAPNMPPRSPLPPLRRVAVPQRGRGAQLVEGCVRPTHVGR